MLDRHVQVLAMQPSLYCPRCGAIVADPEYLGQIAEKLLPPDALAALRRAIHQDVPKAVQQIEDISPGLGAAFACYVGTCSDGPGQRVRGKQRPVPVRTPREGP